MAAVRRGGAVWECALRTARSLEGLLPAIEGAHFAITGSTGLVCSHLVRTLLCLNDLFDAGIELALPVRNREFATRLFGEGVDIALLDWTLGEEPDVPEGVDFFVHGACTTASRDFVERPVETALGIVDGTHACLEAADRRHCGAFVYLSSMEVYGTPARKPAAEGDLGPHDPSSLRSSYPIAKIMAENLVNSFGVEYGIRTVSLRLAQTFGAGVSDDDNRVFAQFARAAIKGEDISLATDGSKRNCYVSLGDTARAILTVCATSDSRGAYNVSNQDTYCSIREMAEFVLSRFGRGGERVCVSTDPEAAKKYPKSSDLLLDASRLEGLGWKASENLEQMYSDLMSVWNG